MWAMPSARSTPRKPPEIHPRWYATTPATATPRRPSSTGQWGGDATASAPALARGTVDEKESQLARLADFHARHADEAPAALERLKAVALAGGNLFDELMQTVRVASLGQITEAFFEVGGRYRRTM